MITADRAIVIFNKFVDSENRRGMYAPTAIMNVSYYESVGMVQNDINRSQSDTFRLRIPYMEAEFQGGRKYIGNPEWKSLADRSGNWTIAAGDYILLVKQGEAAPELDGEYTEKQVKDLAGTGVFCGPEIVISSFADNTVRGSEYVWHWRIGGN